MVQGGVAPARAVAWICAALAPVGVLVALGGAIGVAVPGFYGG